MVVGVFFGFLFNFALSFSFLFLVCVCCGCCILENLLLYIGFY